MLPAAVAVVFALLLWKLRRIPKDGRRGSGLPLDADSVEESLSVNISRDGEVVQSIKGIQRSLKASCVDGSVYVGVSVVREASSSHRAWPGRQSVVRSCRGLC